MTKKTKTQEKLVTFKNLFRFLQDINGKPSYKRIIGFGCFLNAVLLTWLVKEASLGLIAIFLGAATGDSIATIWEKNVKTS
jgi:hypothetical protein